MKKKNLIYSFRKVIIYWGWFPFFIALAYYYLPSQFEVSAFLKDVDPKHIYVIAVINLLHLLSMSLIFYLLLRFYLVDFSLLQSIGITAMSSIGNYVTSLGGGTIGKAYYLNKRHNFSYSAFISSIASIQVLDLLWISLLGCSAVVVCGWMLEVGGEGLFVVFLSVGFLVLVILVYAKCFRIDGTKPGMALGLVIKGWELICRDRELISKIAILLFINHILVAFELMTGYKTFGININFFEAILLGLCSSLSLIIKLTPANLGVQETVIAFSSQVIGIGFGEGLLVAGLLRVVSVIVVFLLGGIFSFSLIDGSFESNTLDMIDESRELS